MKPKIYSFVDDSGASWLSDGHDRRAVEMKKGQWFCFTTTYGIKEKAACIEDAAYFIRFGALRPHRRLTVRDISSLVDNYSRDFVHEQAMMASGLVYSPLPSLSASDTVKVVNVRFI